MKNEDKLKEVLDRVREQLFDPNLYTVLKQVIDEALVEAYEKGYFNGGGAGAKEPK